jgi:hypothetical protein
MGLGLFLLNPIDVSCAVIGALTVVLSGISTTAQVAVLAVFIAVGSISVAIPVIILQIRGDAAKDSLERMRAWIAGNPHVLKAALLVVIAIMQLSKGLESL